MSRLFAATLFVVAVAGVKVEGMAQEVVPVQGPILQEPNQARLNELREWYPQARAWYKWAQEWFNKAHKKTAFGLGKRKQLPDEPSWLGTYCLMRSVEAQEDKLFKASCDLLAAITTLKAGEPVNLQIQIEREDKDKKQTHTKWPERIHLDLMYMPTQSNVPHTMAFVGTHMTIFDVGRVQFFIPPGVLLLSVPAGNGRSLKLAYDWGISIRLVDFQIPGTKQLASMHLNITKVWTQGNLSHELGARSGMDMAGLSLTWKKH